MTGGRLKPSARLLDLAHDTLGAAGLGDLGRFLGQRQRVVPAAFRGGDVDQPHQVGGSAGHEPDLPPQPQRLLQPLARRVQPAGLVLRDPEVPERVGLRQLVAGLCGELQGPFEGGDRGTLVVPDDLVEAADPEQSLALPARASPSAR